MEMTLRLKMALSLLGIGFGALTPFVTAYAIATPASTQYHPQAPAAASPEKVAEDSVVAEPAAPEGDAAATTTAVVDKGGKAKGSFKDQPAAPKGFTWEGPFVGVYLGGAAGKSNINTNVGVVSAPSYFSTNADIAAVNSSASGTIHPNSAIGGVQFGNNSQIGHIVYGGVIDFGWFNLSGSKGATNVAYPGSAGSYTVKSYMSTSWLATARARIGYVRSNCWPLIYITGGPALTNIHIYNAFKDTSIFQGVGGSTNTKNKFGWVIGAGLEFPLYTNWTIGGEYEYVNFGSKNQANGFVTCANGACSAFRSPISTSANLSANMFKLALSYKL